MAKADDDSLVGDEGLGSENEADVSHNRSILGQELEVTNSLIMNESAAAANPGSILKRKFTSSMPGGVSQSQFGGGRSMLGRSVNMNQSLNRSGLDIASRKSVGSFFSSMREKMEMKTTRSNFKDTSRMNGQEYVRELVKQQESRYHKKFAFERGQYHQCIPNPVNPSQMITVQLVKSMLKGMDDLDDKTAKDAKIGAKSQINCGKDMID